MGYAFQGAGYWGQFDLAGDVFEWNLDWSATYVACTDCAYLTNFFYRVFRGGSFSVLATYLLPPVRNSLFPNVRVPDIGFRCARTPVVP